MSDEPLDSGTTTRIMVDAILGSGFIFSEILPFVKTTKYNGILQFFWKFVKDRFATGANPTVGTIMTTVEEGFTVFSASLANAQPVPEVPETPATETDPIIGIPENSGTGGAGDVSTSIPPGQFVPGGGTLTDWQSSWQGPVLGTESGLGGWHGGNYTVMPGNSVLGGYNSCGNVYGTLGNYPGNNIFGINIGTNTDHVVIDINSSSTSSDDSRYTTDTVIDKINVGTDTSLDSSEIDHVTVVILDDSVSDPGVSDLGVSDPSVNESRPIVRLREHSISGVVESNDGPEDVESI